MRSSSKSHVYGRLLYLARHLHAQPRGQCCHDGGYQNPRQCISREQSLANRNPAPLANVEVLIMSMSYASRKPQSRAETEANACLLYTSDAADE